MHVWFKCNFSSCLQALLLEQSIYPIQYLELMECSIDSYGVDRLARYLRLFNKLVYQGRVDILSEVWRHSMFLSWGRISYDKYSFRFTAIISV